MNEGRTPPGGHMRALVYADWGVVEIRGVPRPVAGPAEALVRVEACGICGSELESFRTRSPRRTPPLVLGHEFCGTVASVGPGASRFAPGDRVVSNSMTSCGGCAPCRRGDGNLCERRRVFGMQMPGALAEFVVAPDGILFARPSGLSAVEGAVVEPLANAVHVVRLLPQMDRPTVAIMGAGPIGLFALQVARAERGARTLVTEVDAGRRRWAAALGADAVVDPSAEDAREACRALSGSDGADFCIDAVGSRDTRALSVKALRPGGHAVWIGLHENTTAFDGYDVILAERRVIGSYCATADDFRQAMALLEAGSVRVDGWVETRPLAEAAELFRGLAAGRTAIVKAVVLP